MSKKLLLASLASVLLVSSYSVSAAQQFTAGSSCTTNFITLSGTGLLSDSIVTASPGMALVLIANDDVSVGSTGLYCGFGGLTAGESSLIRSMAVQAYESGKKFSMSVDTFGSVQVYTVLP